MESARLCTAHVVLLAQSRFRILDDRTFQAQVHFGWEPKPNSVSLYTMYTREHLRHRQGGRLSFHIISLSPALPLNVELVPQYMTWESFPMWQGKLHSPFLQRFILNHLAARPFQHARGFWQLQDCCTSNIPEVFSRQNSNTEHLKSQIHALEFENHGK